MAATQEVIRIVDSICRDKNIDRELVYADLEAAMVSAAPEPGAGPPSRPHATTTAVATNRLHFPQAVIMRVT